MPAESSAPLLKCFQFPFSSCSEVSFSRRSLLGGGSHSLPTDSLRTAAGEGSGHAAGIAGSGPGSGPRHDGRGEAEPAVLQAVHREEPEPRVHPQPHDGLAVRR